MRLFDNFIFKSVSILFLLINGEAHSDNIWRENITINKYMVDYSCKFSGMTTSRGLDFVRTTEEYVIILQSKYNMFVNYNMFPDNNPLHYNRDLVIPSDYNLHTHRLLIDTPLHEINPLRVRFNSRAEVSIYLSSLHFDRLMQSDGFFVYYPSIVFDRKWMQDLGRRHLPQFDSLPFMLYSKLVFSSNLSSAGLIKTKEACHAEIEAQRAALEEEQVVFERENRKPINRLRNFFDL